MSMGCCEVGIQHNQREGTCCIGRNTKIQCHSVRMRVWSPPKPTSYPYPCCRLALQGVTLVAPHIELSIHLLKLQLGGHEFLFVPSAMIPGCPQHRTLLLQPPGLLVQYTSMLPTLQHDALVLGQALPLGV